MMVNSWFIAAMSFLSVSGTIDMKHNIELTTNQLMAAIVALELFNEDYQNNWDDIDPNFKKGVDQTENKLKKEFKKLAKKSS